MYILIVFWCLLDVFWCLLDVFCLNGISVIKTPIQNWKEFTSVAVCVINGSSRKFSNGLFNGSEMLGKCWLNLIEVWDSWHLCLESFFWFAVWFPQLFQKRWSLTWFWWRFTTQLDFLDWNGCWAMRLPFEARLSSSSHPKYSLAAS